MKFLVIGCGSIGRRHIRNIKSLGHEVFAVDINEEYRKWVEENLGVKTLAEVEKAIDKQPDAALVCTPPNTHISLARIVVENNLHVFIEKPLSHNLERIDELIKAIKKRKRKGMVGYNLRFNSSLLKAKEVLKAGNIGKPLSIRIVAGQYLPYWRPWQDYRKSYTASKRMGGGVILDGSHELDYARWLFGEANEISCMADRVSKLEVETEDVAEINIKFKSGALANVHLDFIRHDYARNCEVVGEEGTLKWDFGKGSVEVYSAKTKETDRHDIPEDPNAMYVKEMEHFIGCITKNKEPTPNLEEGKKSLELALAAKQAAEKKKTIRLGT